MEGNFHFLAFVSIQSIHNHAAARKHAGATVIISGNLTTAAIPVRPLLNTSDVLIFNQAELGLLLDRMELPAPEELFRLGLKAVIETRGADGSLIRTPDDEIKVPAAPAQSLVDTVGAGDAFAGGFATAVSKGWSFQEAAMLGSTVASFVLEQIGCQTNLPDWQLAAERLKQVYALDKVHSPT